jgi:hypothetical protein
MVETTILTLAATNKASLRTTVPMSIVKHFGLKQGDRLEWTFEVKNADIVVIMKPLNKS